MKTGTVNISFQEGLLQQIDETARIDLDACRAFAARLGSNASFAVKRLGDNARQRRLADTARASEQVGMMQALLLERIGQRPHRVLLPDQFGKSLGPPLACEYLGHVESVNG